MSTDAGGSVLIRVRAKRLEVVGYAKHRDRLKFAALWKTRGPQDTAAPCPLADWDFLGGGRSSKEQQCKSGCRKGDPRSA